MRNRANHQPLIIEQAGFSERRLRIPGATNGLTEIIGAKEDLRIRVRRQINQPIVAELNGASARSLETMLVESLLFDTIPA